MKATKKQSELTPADSVVQQLAAIEGSLKLSDGMTRAERKGQKSLSRNVPDKLIELVADLANQSGGSVAGIPFDAAAASATLTYVSEAQKIVAAAEGLALHVSDDSIERRTAVANESFAVYSALGRLVRTAKGKPLRQKYEAMQSLVRESRRKTTTSDATTTQADASTTAAKAGAAETVSRQQATTTTPQASTAPAAH